MSSVIPNREERDFSRRFFRLASTAFGAELFGMLIAVLFVWTICTALSETPLHPWSAILVIDFLFITFSAFLAELATPPDVKQDLMSRSLISFVVSTATLAPLATYAAELVIGESTRDTALKMILKEHGGHNWNLFYSGLVVLLVFISAVIAAWSAWSIKGSFNPDKEARSLGIWPLLSSALLFCVYTLLIHQWVSVPEHYKHIARPSTIATLLFICLTTFSLLTFILSSIHGLSQSRRTDVRQIESATFLSNGYVRIVSLVAAGVSVFLLLSQNWTLRGLGANVEPIAAVLDTFISWLIWLVLGLALLIGIHFLANFLKDLWRQLKQVFDKLRVAVRSTFKSFWDFAGRNMYRTTVRLRVSIRNKSRSFKSWWSATTESLELWWNTMPKRFKLGWNATIDKFRFPVGHD